MWRNCGLVTLRYHLWFFRLARSVPVAAVCCVPGCVVLGREGGAEGTGGLLRDCDQPGGTLRRVRPSKRHDTTPWLQGRRYCDGLPAGDIGLHGWRGAPGCASGRCRAVRSSAADVFSWLRRGTCRPAQGGRSQRRPVRPSRTGLVGERYGVPGSGRRGITGRGRGGRCRRARCGRTGRGTGIFRHERRRGRGGRAGPGQDRWPPDRHRRQRRSPGHRRGLADGHRSPGPQRRRRGHGLSAAEPAAQRRPCPAARQRRAGGRRRHRLR